MNNPPTNDGHLRSCWQIDFTSKCWCIFPDISADCMDCSPSMSLKSRKKLKTLAASTGKHLHVFFQIFLKKKRHTRCHIFLPRHRVSPAPPRVCFGCPGFAQLKGSRPLRLPESQRLPTRTADARGDPRGSVDDLINLTEIKN